MELPLLKLHEFWPSQQLSATNCYPPPLLGLWSIVTLSCRAANHCKTQLSLRLRVAVDREWIFIQNLSKESLSLCNTPRKDKFLFMVLTRSQKPQKKTWNKSQESSVKSSAEDSVFLTLIQPACCSSRHFNYHFAHMLVQWPGWTYAGRPSMIPASTYDLRLSTAVQEIMRACLQCSLTDLPPSKQVKRFQECLGERPIDSRILCLRCQKVIFMSWPKESYFSFLGLAIQDMPLLAVQSCARWLVQSQPCHLRVREWCEETEHRETDPNVRFIAMECRSQGHLVCGSGQNLRYIDSQNLGTSIGAVAISWRFFCIGRI